MMESLGIDKMFKRKKVKQEKTLQSSLKDKRRQGHAMASGRNAVPEAKDNQDGLENRAISGSLIVCLFVYLFFIEGAISSS